MQVGLHGAPLIFGFLMRPGSALLEIRPHKFEGALLPRRRLRPLVHQPARLDKELELQDILTPQGRCEVCCDAPCSTASPLVYRMPKSDGIMWRSPAGGPTTAARRCTVWRRWNATIHTFDTLTSADAVILRPQAGGPTTTARRRTIWSRWCARSQILYQYLPRLILSCDAAGWWPNHYSQTTYNLEKVVRFFYLHTSDLNWQAGDWEKRGPGAMQKE